MDNCKKEMEQHLSAQKEVLESKKMMKKIRKSGSYLSMENLDLNGDDVEEDEEEEPEKKNGKNNQNNDLPSLRLDSENLTFHPVYILEQAFSKVNAVGSSTAMVAIRN